MLKVKTQTINLNDTNYKIGYQLGMQVKNDDSLKAKYVLYKTDVSKKDVEEANLLFDRWCPGLREEIAGFADALQIELEFVFFYSMTYLQPRCSQIAVLSEVTKDQKPYLARNYEFDHTLEDYCLMKTQIKDKYIHIGTSMLLFGRDDGFNEHGLSITMSSCGIPIANLPNMKKATTTGLQYWVVVRALLEQCKDVEEAIAYIKNMPIAFHMNMILLDKAENLALVQTMNGKCEIKRIDTKTQHYLHATNHSLLPNFIRLEPEGLTHSIVRYSYIEQELHTQTSVTKEKLKEMLLAKYPNGLCFHYFLEGFGTTKSMLISPKDGTIEICWGGLISNGWRTYNIEEEWSNETIEISILNKKMPTSFFLDYHFVKKGVKLK